MAVMTIVKFGIRYKNALPVKLHDWIDAMERTIRLSMTGTNYYEFYRVKECLEFDISWNQGTWTFVQRGLYEDDNYDQRRVHIQAGKETFLSYVWGNVFGLQFSRSNDGGTCFMVTDFQLKPSLGRVEFHGYYYWETGKRTTFKSTFQFSATNFYVRVTTEEKYMSEHEAVEEFWESCFQKPDPANWRESWDNHFHDPPFIQSTYDFLTHRVWS